MVCASELMLICLTGSSGFLGAHVAAALVDEGHRLRVTYRDRARLGAVDGLADEGRKADLLDRSSMRRAFVGAEAVISCAGVVGSSERAWQVNARGPRLVVEAAAKADVHRVVHTSSVVAVGPSRQAEPADEDSIYRGGHLGLTYVDSKHEGEGEAKAAALRVGQDLVVVNPAYVLGVPLDPADPPPSTSRQMLDFLAGRMSVMVEGETNVVDVRDVAGGHLLALEHGRSGERYILAGENITWAKLAAAAGRVSGVTRPVVMVPGELARLAHVQDLLGLPPLLTGGLLTRLAAPSWQYTSGKAERDLGYRPRPLEETLRDIHDWYRDLVAKGALAPASTRSGALARAGRAGLYGLMRSLAHASGHILGARD